MAFDKGPNFTVGFKRLYSTPLRGGDADSFVTVIPLPTNPNEYKEYKKEWRYGQEWVDCLRGGDKENFMPLRTQATPLNIIKGFFGMRLNTQDVIRMADQIYIHLPDKFQVEDDIKNTLKRKQQGTTRDGSFSYTAGRFSVPLAQEHVPPYEYTPLRSACILMQLSEAGLVPEYDRLNNLTEIQKRTFLMRIAKDQRYMAEMLLKNNNEIKRDDYGAVLLQEATRMLEEALQTSSGNLEN